MVCLGLNLGRDRHVWRACQGKLFRVILLSFLLFLSQAAQSQQAATVTLAWDPSDSPAIAAYRIYYGPQSGTYTNFLDLPVVLQAQIPGLAWGATYYFAVTAISSNGMESILSNEVSYR